MCTCSVEKHVLDSLFLNLNQSVIHCHLSKCSRSNTDAWLLRWGHLILGALSKGTSVWNPPFSEEVYTSHAERRHTETLRLGREMPWHSQAAPALSLPAPTAASLPPMKTILLCWIFPNSSPTDFCRFKLLLLDTLNRIRLYKCTFKKMEKSNARIEMKWICILISEDFNFFSFNMFS